MAEHNPSGTLQYYILSKLAHFSAGGASTPELRGAGLLARARQAGRSAGGDGAGRGGKRGGTGRDPLFRGLGEE